MEQSRGMQERKDARVIGHPRLSHTAPACKFGCLYCFASDPAYFAALNVSEPADESTHDSKTPEVIMLSGDTELFVAPDTGLTQLKEALRHGCHVTFSTKTVLPDAILRHLKQAQDVLREQNKILSVMVSIPTLQDDGFLEPRVPRPKTRIQFLQTLREAGLHPYVGIRPILPPGLVCDDDLCRIVDACGPFAHGFITGPYWFFSDTFHLLGRDDLTIERRRVHWLPGNPEWFVYEDLERERTLIDYISTSGYRHYRRSSEAVREIAAEVMG